MLNLKYGRFRGKMIFIKILALAILICSVIALCMPSNAYAEDSEILENVKIESLEGKRAGVMVGTPQEEVIRNNVDKLDVYYYNSMADMALALYEDKIDCFVNTTVGFRMIQQSYPDFRYIDHNLATYDVATIFPKNEDGQALCDQYNEYIDEIKEDGTLDELQEYWLRPREWEEVDIPEEGENGILTLATSTSMKPFSMMIDEGYGGFDIAIVAGFCKEYGYGLEIKDTDFAGVLAGVQEGKFDFAAGQISWTQERSEAVLFSDFYYNQNLVAIVDGKSFNATPSSSGTSSVDQQSDSSASQTDSSAIEEQSQSSDKQTAVKTEENPGFWEKVKSGFNKTFVKEHRWKLILRGLGNTMIITLFGFLLANGIGALFCAMTMSKSKVLHVISDIYSRIMQGTPIVVVLMILYYLIFAGDVLPGIVVSIIGFGLTSGAYLAQIFEGAISGVDKGQWEASMAIGFTGGQTFWGIVMPQAVRTMLPGYFSCLISLMKGTAIVGYIAIMDLTKVGDIIRSATYDAFFPLISIAVIYFAIACVLLSILHAIQKKLAPKRVTMTEGGKDA